MLDFIKKAIFIGAGLASMTAEKIQEAVDEIVKKGELSEKQGRELLEELFERSAKARKEMSERVEKLTQDALEKLKIPTRREMDELKARIDELERRGTAQSGGTGQFEAGEEKG
jgi:polyhydroxyalkanoate synthesis regulator phasin